MRSNEAVELELFRNLFTSVAEEMGIVLRKTALSANIKERRDYSCAVYDSAGNTIAMGDHMPVHLGAMPLSVKHALDAFSLRPGDVAILNDPFRGGTHLPDITAVSRAGSFIVANRAHHADVGGMSPGSMPMAREIYQEGLRIPPILLVREGKVDEPLLDLILANVRTPDERRGDLLAQLMAMRRGEERLAAMTARYGLRKLQRSAARLQDYAERRMRSAISQVPDGVYRFEDWLDGDGMGSGAIRIAVTLTVAGNGAVVDFRDCDRQAQGPVNANVAIVVSAVAYVFRCLLEDSMPFNAGLLRPLQILTTPGTAVDAVAPAAMAGGNVETSQRITDVLLGALAQAMPGIIPAASSGTMNNLSFGGWDGVRGRPFAYYETIAGGMGAGPEHAGGHAVHTHMTNSWNTPVEALEHQYPMRIRSYSIRRGSGGEGARAGGDGIVREWEFLASAKATLLADRRERGPYGLAGGEPGVAGRSLLNGAPLPGKVEFEAKAGDVLTIETPGGGGHGLAGS